MTTILIILSVFVFAKAMSGIQQMRRFEAMLNPKPDGKPSYVVFDVETTGLAPKYIPESANDLETGDYPYIVSIAWLVLSEDCQLIRSEHHLVRPPVSIPFEATRIHGITDDRAQSEGKALKPILERLAIDLAAAGKCVAHNLMFDKTVVAAERIRWALPDPFHGIVGLDTMRLGADWMGRRSFKLYDGVAKVVPSGIRTKLKAHDALGDATAVAYLLAYSLQWREKNGHRVFRPDPERPQVTLVNPGGGVAMVVEGDQVKLWIPADENRGNFYAYGSIAGDGKVGELTSDALDWVLAQRNTGNELDFTVAKKSRGGCVLDIHIKTAAEIVAEQEVAFQQILAELVKPYSPKKPQKFSLQVEEFEAFKWVQGLQLEVHLPHPDSFHPARTREDIEFKISGITVGAIFNKSDSVRLIRAVNSGYSLRAEVIEVKRKQKHARREVAVAIDFDATHEGSHLLSGATD
jgi:DNA polymerase III epsilon subunit-like protein